MAFGLIGGLASSLAREQRRGTFWRVHGIGELCRTQAVNITYRPWESALKAFGRSTYSLLLVRLRVLNTVPIR